ncbi:hypothetical protein HMPREF9442_01434 [Paraprevotella xylaniphila YIT 11841]|uniref:Uncharacterized protein n=1 Tax=Paraprevotella xylaniphila YIT 11841 TaxID=762982 RepID=F3QTB7_9BACT|nr:hypothetical protein HMPREF9442_01434 [Paraprevotella xylaniphila YIT 11841]
MKIEINASNIVNHALFYVFGAISIKIRNTGATYVKRKCVFL